MPTLQDDKILAELFVEGRNVLDIEKQALRRSAELRQ